MNRSRQTSEHKASARPLAAALLAAGCLLAGSSLHAQVQNRVGWAPTRDEAVVIGGVPSNMLPAETSISKSLMSQRPHNLSRPAPTRSQTFFTQAPTATESLPTISGAPTSPEGLPVPPEMYYDDGQPIDGFIDGDMHNDNCGCGLCKGRCGGGCGWVPLCIYVPSPPLDGLEVFGGVQGFTGPANRGGSGSFGFHEGFNWGLPVAGYMSAQWGAAWTQNNFDGNYITNDQRNQIFFTAGLNRRVDWGFQGGLVFDYLHDEWDYTADLAQIRGELGWLWCDCNEIGVWFAVGVNDASNLVVRQPVRVSDVGIRFIDSRSTLAVNDIYAFYFRRQFACGGQGRLFAGFTGASQGLLGGDAQLPINPNWSLRTNFIFATAGNDNTSDSPAFDRESWNVGISVVWTPCPRNCQNYSRPLFNVADNGTFLTRFLRTREVD